MDMYSELEQPLRPPVAALLKLAEKLGNLSLVHLQQVVLRSTESIAHTFPEGKLQALSAELQPPSDFKANAEQHSHLLAVLHVYACDNKQINKGITDLIRIVINRSKMILDRTLDQPVPPAWTPEHAASRTQSFNKYFFWYLNKIGDLKWIQAYTDALVKAVKMAQALVNPKLQAQYEALFDALSQQIHAFDLDKARSNPRAAVSAKSNSVISTFQKLFENNPARAIHQMQYLVKVQIKRRRHAAPAWSQRAAKPKVRFDLGQKPIGSSAMMKKGEVSALTNTDNYLSSTTDKIKETSEDFKKKSATDATALEECKVKCESLESEVRNMKNKSEFVDDAVHQMVKTIDDLESRLKEVRAELEKKKEQMKLEADGFEYLDL